MLARDRTIAEIVAALTKVAGDGTADLTPREMAETTRKSRREKMLAALVRLEQEGRGRSAAMSVARDFANDRRDAVEVESLARKLRRWRRKISDTVRLPNQKPTREKP